MTGDAEQLGADIVVPAYGGEPRRAAAENIRRDRDRFDIVDCRRATVETDIGGKTRVLPPPGPPSFQALPKGRLLSPAISARHPGHPKVQTPHCFIVPSRY